MLARAGGIYVHVNICMLTLLGGQVVNVVDFCPGA